MTSNPLSVDFVHQTIDNVIASVLPEESPHDTKLKLHRTTSSDDWDVLLSSRSSSDSRKGSKRSSSGTIKIPTDNRPPFYFGVQAESTDSHQPKDKMVGFCTFYIAYSTWDGRILYVDFIDAESDGSLLFYRVMAKIAVEIGCARFTWKQRERPQWNNTGVIPEHLGDWIFLSMDRLAMVSFVGSSPAAKPDPPDGEIIETKSLYRQYVESVIQQYIAKQTKSTKMSTVNLRLAGPEDIETIARLVQLLAIYEKEPDAVNVTAHDYFLDGYNSKEPQFYCILADVSTGIEEADDISAPKATVAMGLFYFGYDLLNGPFVYLEDLFCVEAFRGRGVGTAIMKLLAGISLALDCSEFIWSALDWNATALSFYNKIGATTKEELKITRLCGNDLQSFAQSGNLVVR